MFGDSTSGVTGLREGLGEEERVRSDRLAGGDPDAVVEHIPVPHPGARADDGEPADVAAAPELALLADDRARDRARVSDPGSGPDDGGLDLNAFAEVRAGPDHGEAAHARACPDDRAR